MPSFKRTDRPIPSAANPKPEPAQPESSNKSSSKQFAPHSYDHVKTILTAIVKARGTHIPDALLPSIGIKGATFDLKSGASSDGGCMYLAPQLANVVESLLMHTKPWAVTSYATWTDDHAQDWDRHELAIELSNLLEGYLCMNADDSLPGIINQTNWRARALNHPFEQAMYFRGGDQKWNAQFIIESADPSAVPHIACFLVDRAPMLENEFSRAELMTVLALTADRVQIYSKLHDVFPVTLFSMSSRNFRIIHAYYDPGKENLIVRRSQILQFHQINTPDLHLALSWMIGIPH